MNISILADCRKEFRVNASGAVVASMRGVARICDVDDKSIRYNLGAEQKPTKLAQMLKDKGFEPAELAKNGFPDTAVAIVVEYYAFEAGRYCTERAKSFYRMFASIGIRVFLKEWLGTNVQPSRKTEKEDIVPIGSFFNSGTTRNGYIWRLFWYRNNDGERHLIPVIFRDDIWYVQISAVRSAFNASYSMVIDWEIDLDEFDWMFLGTCLEQNKNFSSVAKVQKVLKQHNLLQVFDNWASQLNVFSEPKSIVKQEELVIQEKTEKVVTGEVSDSMTVFHHFAMRLINEVHKDNLMSLTNEELKRGMLEVAFDMLKFVSNV